MRRGARFNNPSEVEFATQLLETILDGAEDAFRKSWETDSPTRARLLEESAALRRARARDYLDRLRY